MKAIPSAFRTLLPAVICGFLLPALPPPACAAEAGAWETFFSQDNADAWAVYDYVDDETYLPGWNDTNAGEEYIFFPHTDDAPLWFFTDVFTMAGQGALIGNFATEKVQAILASVFIDSLPDFDALDCVVLATGPNGRGYYSTNYYLSEDFESDGWFEVRFGFDETWYYETATDFLPIAVTTQMLSTIEEIGFRFFPVPGATGAHDAAIDDVKLEPLVAAPVLNVTRTGTNFKLAFTPGNAVTCVIERLITDPVMSWEGIPGQAGIVGPNEHEFITPITGSSGFFRVQSSAEYTPFTTDPPLQP